MTIPQAGDVGTRVQGDRAFFKSLLPRRAGDLTQGVSHIPGDYPNHWVKSYEGGFPLLLFPILIYFVLTHLRG